MSAHPTLEGPFIWKRGEGNKRRVNHLAAFDRLGRCVGSLCGSQLEFDTSCNLPLGRRTCKRCSAKYSEVANG